MTRLNRNASLAFALTCWTPLIGCKPPSVETAPSAVGESVPSLKQPAALEELPNSAHADFYTVSTYDKSADPVDALAKTIARAQVENKRVILQVGGDWCGWCSRITDYMSTNNAVRSHIEKNFLVMKVTFPGDHARCRRAAAPAR